jgi:hypothetical protein
MDYVEGISMENFLYRGLPRRLPMEVIVDMFNNRLNKTRVVRGAIFDLLTSQCDRHAQNLFLQEDGNLQLIDNESCLQHMWKTCGFDSVLVPTTQKCVADGRGGSDGDGGGVMVLMPPRKSGCWAWMGGQKAGGVREGISP